MILNFMIGLVIWTLVEYIYHKYYLHIYNENLPESNLINYINPILYR